MLKGIRDADRRGLYVDLRGCTGISDDSRTVKKGDIFFAVQGAKFDGGKFIDEAVRKGAAAVVTGKTHPGGCTPGVQPPGCKTVAKIIRVDNPRAALAQFASDFYDRPSKKVKVIGITGTNGKTTISYLLEEIFKKAGYEAGIIGTIAHRWKDKIIEARNTTPGSIELQQLLNNMACDGVHYCAMEVSSHSLDQDRVLGIDFNAAIFTNIAGEHLDYHKTFENYLDAKIRLFKNLKSSSLAVLNSDDPNFKKIKKATSARILTYGIKNKADIFADEIKFDLEKNEFLIRIDPECRNFLRSSSGCRRYTSQNVYIRHKDKKGRMRGGEGSFKVRSPLVGDFNVYNILAAAGAALNEGIEIDTIKKAILDFKGVEGRLEGVETNRGFKVFIDYAHTDHALENVLRTLRPLVENRLIVVFGCGGERDRFKRPRMGNISSRISDFVFITSDNPRGEEPLAIAKEVEKGIDKNFKSYEIILDRYEAIKNAIGIARPGDMVLIAGKGHEKYQIIGDRALPFSDREVVREIILKSQITNSKSQTNSNYQMTKNPSPYTLSPKGRGKACLPDRQG